MNFLEQLVAEWYEYNDHLVRTNIHYGKRARGGWEGEMDVVAFHPADRELLHIETSTDALNWGKRRKIFERKYATAKRHYATLFPFEHGRIRQIAIVGFQRQSPKDAWGDGIEIQSIPEFTATICKQLSRKHPLKAAVPERFSLIRAMQFTLHLGIHKSGGLPSK